MMMNRAVRVGGKKAPRRAPTKKQVDADNDKGFLTALSANGYKCSEVKDVNCCSFMADTDSVISYQEPEVKAVTKDNVIIGYIVKGKGELLGENNKNFDLDSIIKYLATKGVNIEGLVEKVKEGDKKALEEILDLVKAAAIEEDKEKEEKEEKTE
ncbi:hypothetical protein NEAUS04_1643 [Nematocida ausubeli]|uniref:Nascent polypeptide-associated complex subunit beta n=2 Tax=Nematocida ausubeli (strain ATCC PRA-371 / ERTm2) TaxID=1913371 RepID=H8ZD17_NEMA1|nr:hypothetical protein NERG_01164 [Nematocida ausubeli]KAI5136162.1 hypothetical protein NEAUS06_1785 [Nematocida ausubeli]KAI5146978.1 hypothetical protein NEAUS05_0314 [Nematocida ausubeli]KAI5163537.1 hypothetical protein NEAUS04_1643 [Nematocida ausubeli]